MIRISQLKLNIGHKDSELRKVVLKKLRIKEEQLCDIKIFRRSLDARDNLNIKYIYTVDVSIYDEDRVLKKFSRDKNISRSEPVIYRLPEQGNEILTYRPCIVGSGPAGLFCTYFLAKNGYRPILIEQGQDVDERQKSVEAFWNEEKGINPLSNVQFGEGGAGTFSDGKLNSSVKDVSGRKTEVLKTFVKGGASEEILFAAKPHVGTDVLRKVVKNLREEIKRCGGEVLFNTKFIDFTAPEGKLRSITVCEADLKTREIPCTKLVLAIGHSSRDTFELLYRKGLKIQSKPFAVGVRCEHTRDMIDASQYGQDYRKLYEGRLPAADYKVTYKSKDGHGVYSFCMCPGGYVVNSSSEEGRICVNGMSYSGRNGKNSNSAIIVSVSPEDIGAADDPMKAVNFQRELEEKAYTSGNGRIPVQRLADFYSNESSTSFGKITSETKGAVSFANLNDVLPEFISRNLKEAFPEFGKMIRGFDAPDTLLSAVETRTSSPIKILRDESMQSNIRGIYPCGEGAGYAGGITSSAIDGIKVFEEIYKTCRP